MKIEPKTTAKEINLFFKKNSLPLSGSELEEAKRFSPTRLEIRRLSKAHRESLLKQDTKVVSEADQAQLWIDVFKATSYIGLQSIAIEFFKARQKRKSFDLVSWWPKLSELCPKIDCWTTGDMMASLYSQIHESAPQRVFPKLKEWNSSEKPWMIRMSILSLYYYSACRKEFPSFSKSASFLKPHLNHEHYYVQKSIGWTLREMHNVYPDETKGFIDDYLLKIHPDAFSAATEKIRGPQKDSWKNERAHHRKQKGSFVRTSKLL